MELREEGVPLGGWEVGGQLMMVMECLSQVRPCHLLELEYVREITGIRRHLAPILQDYAEGLNSGPIA